MRSTSLARASIASHSCSTKARCFAGSATSRPACASGRTDISSIASALLPDELIGPSNSLLFLRSLRGAGEPRRRGLALRLLEALELGLEPRQQLLRRGALLGAARAR